MPVDLASLVATTAFKETAQSIRDALVSRAARHLEDHELSEAYAHAARLWGCVLHEMRAGCERARLLSSSVRQGRLDVLHAPFSFEVSNALLPDLYRTVPDPQVVERLRLVDAALRRIDYFLRIATSTHGDGLGQLVNAARVAEDVLGKGLVDSYNWLRERAELLALAAAHPHPVVEGFLPPRIDPAAEVDRAVL